jgi:hypothetical protein
MVLAVVGAVAVPLERLNDRGDVVAEFNGCLPIAGHWPAFPSADRLRCEMRIDASASAPAASASASLTQARQSPPQSSDMASAGSSSCFPQIPQRDAKLPSITCDEG